MARDLRVSIDRRAVERLARDRAVLDYTHQVAEAAVDDIESRAPAIVKSPANARFYAKRDSDGSTVVVKSSWWHFPEFGARYYPANSYIRPAVQRILSRVKGRWKSQ